MSAPQSEDAALDPADVAGTDHRQVVRLARLEHGVPQLLALAAGLVQVDLVALALRPWVDAPILAKLDPCLDQSRFGTERLFAGWQPLHVPVRQSVSILQ